ncbi:hypothetical protein GCM10022225_84850 [Plantactinospora mayteni]
MIGKPSSPVRREAARKRDQPRLAPRRAADPSGWLMHHRRLVRDHEARTDNSASMINIAMIDNLAKRLTTETTPTWRHG